MFLRRAGIQLVILPTNTSSLSSSSSPASAAGRAATHHVAFSTSLPVTSSFFSAFQGENTPRLSPKFTPPPFNRYGRDFGETFACPLSSSKLSVLLGTTMMMGASKCKNYHSDQQHRSHLIHQEHRRLYHHLHLKSSEMSVFHRQLVSNSSSNGSNNSRQFSGAKSARDHNNWPFSRSSSCSNNKSSTNSVTTASFSTNSTSTGDGGSSSSETLVVTIKDGLSSRDSADDFLSQLTDNQKQLIYHTLNIEILRDKYEGTLGSSRQESHHYLSRFGRPATQKEDPTGTLCEVSSGWLHKRLDEKAHPAPASAIWAVTVKNALPFIGFGFLDNLIMILAGDYIDITIGTALGISTMAAAALGNAISDVAGIGSAWYVEELASKVGIRDPDLTPSQMASGAVRWASNLGRAFGVMIGCLLGMFPLLFLPSAEEAKERKFRKEQEEEKRQKESSDGSKVDKGKFA